MSIKSVSINVSRTKTQSSLECKVNGDEGYGIERECLLIYPYNAFICKWNSGKLHKNLNTVNRDFFHILTTKLSNLQ